MFVVVMVVRIDGIRTKSEDSIQVANINELLSVDVVLISSRTKLSSSVRGALHH